MSGHGKSKRHRVGEEPEQGAAVTAPPLAPGLYLVATPIGNAGDITLRALEVLARADVLACEDTRRTRQLMAIHGIGVEGRPIISYHDRNGAARRPQIMRFLEQGMSVAYASDAGTPLVSDPGFRLVEAAHEGGHEVHAVPGASAVLAALSVAGLPSDRFMFIGFLPPRQGARRRVLQELASVPATLIAFEAPHRAPAALADMAEVLGADRSGAMARELTKKFEEVRRGTLGTLAAEIGDADAVKG
ncbi:MAG TPA: 16S rRNA (cytidine(1402)-2'-O)-methyltransferase, partial [Paracoccaceae bacterium]|nr:16S rRNA (cytidine(1402)-2'-O)-methyltransferase [Paracoccaceae bacterium]